MIYKSWNVNILVDVDTYLILFKNNELKENLRTGFCPVLLATQCGMFTQGYP